MNPTGTTVKSPHTTQIEKFQETIDRTLKIAAVFLFSALFSCVGLSDRTMTSMTERDAEELMSLDLALLEYRFSGDEKIPLQVEQRTRALLEAGPPNRESKAEILGLMGIALFYKRDARAAAGTAVLIERESTAEPRLYVLRALLAKDREKKIAVLTDGLSKTERKGLIRLALAEIWFESGDYRNALAAFDDAFLGLPPRYRELYKKSRDLAFQFMDRAPGTADTRDISAKNELTVSDVIVLTARETRFFEPVTGDPKIPPPSLYRLLLDRNYLPAEVPPLPAPMPRKDIACLLIRILAYLEHDAALLVRYTGADAMTAASPVPDLKPTDYFYNAALVLVEREIMNLPDGINFHPEKTMSGAEYFDILKKLKTLYR